MADKQSIHEEIEEILVDSYGEDEQMASWGVVFEDRIAVPFSATLMGIPIEVTEFRTSDTNVLQCQVIREGKKRWIAVEDIDPEGLPEDMAHMLNLFTAWNSGDY